MAKFTDRYGGYCTCTREKCSDECSTYRRYKPIPTTNADRLRAKTDEELAELFSQLCCPCSLGGRVDCNAENKGCKACWLDWLRQEVQG